MGSLSAHDSPDEQGYFFDERYPRLLEQLSREVWEEEKNAFIEKYGKRKWDELEWLIRAHTLDEDLILWAKKQIFPRHGEHAAGLHKLKSTFEIIEKITGDLRFVLSRKEGIIHRDIPTRGD